ncbi:hypothetical protein B4U79_07091 [Dinothrombium tinctorium]|uniref:Serine hydrolase domain-containing protein n=1 Tax=Dinothrombium tinctorium TaxID=1965070 RepID=A0A3S4QFJ1_9ACAR|nr:hypothetical protein B4U79_07091 [Dinothrombium tinctorium]
MVLKILCLHGYRQNANSFRQKTGGFRKMLKNHAEFVFIDAPHSVPIGDQNPEGCDEFKSWWFSEQDPNAFYSKKHSSICIGFEESLKGPFDGLLGFSQGGAMVALIAALIQQQKFDHKFKFTILFAAFQSENTAHEKLYTQAIEIPTLFVIGQSDTVIPKELSEKLVSCFPYAEIIYHIGGHCVPSSSSNKKQFIDFLNKFIN